MHMESSLINLRALLLIEFMSIWRSIRPISCALKFSFYVLLSLYINISSDEPFWSPALNRDQFFRRLSVSDLLVKSLW